MLKVGIVGCGAIGSSLARAIAGNFSKDARLVALYDIDSVKSSKLAKRIARNITVKSLEELIRRSDLVIEAASASASLKIAKSALSRGRDIMVMSVGGLVGNVEQLNRLARKNKARVYIPSGAISGIDALKASKIGRIKEVALTTTKNPLSFKGVKYVQGLKVDLGKIKGARVLFSGTAREAVKYFPQNINVAAVLSLAGLGADKTRVKIIASSSAKNNIHEIRIVSSAGTVYTRTENVLHPDNPKTSYLAVLSAIATLKQIMEPLKIGA